MSRSIHRKQRNRDKAIVLHTQTPIIVICANLESQPFMHFHLSLLSTARVRRRGSGAGRSSLATPARRPCTSPSINDRAARAADRRSSTYDLQPICNCIGNYSSCNLTMSPAKRYWTVSISLTAWVQIWLSALAWPVQAICHAWHGKIGTKRV